MSGIPLYFNFIFLRSCSPFFFRLLSLNIVVIQDDVIVKNKTAYFFKGF